MSDSPGVLLVEVKIEMAEVIIAQAECGATIRFAPEGVTVLMG